MNKVMSRYGVTEEFLKVEIEREKNSIRLKSENMDMARKMKYYKPAYKRKRYIKELRRDIGFKLKQLKVLELALIGLKEAKGSE